MRNYNHLNLENRDVIQKLLSKGVLQKDIAIAIGKDPSTISREKKKNTINQEYISHKAQNLTKLRHAKANIDRGRKRNNPFKNQHNNKKSIHDRKSKFLIAFKIDSKHSDTFAEKIKKYFADLDNSKIRTLTLDNGSENARFKNIEEFLNCKIYFCDPHSPWQKGLNENTNGLIRQYFPKGTDFSTITQKELDEVIFLLNNRPRKILGYKTPYEVFFKKPVKKIALRI